MHIKSSILKSGDFKLTRPSDDNYCYNIIVFNIFLHKFFAWAAKPISIILKIQNIVYRYCSRTTELIYIELFGFTKILCMNIMKHSTL